MEKIFVSRWGSGSFVLQQIQNECEKEKPIPLEIGF